MSDFAHICDAFYRSWFIFHPESAVELGVEGFSERLTPYGHDEIAALKVLQEKLLFALDEFNPEKLNDELRIDAELMRGQAIVELETLANFDWRYRDPTRFIPVNAIYQLTLRRVENPKQALLSRLTAIPAYLRGARAYLTAEPEQIPSLWLESACTESLHGAAYLRSLRHHPDFQRYRLEQALDAAAHALEDYAHFLESELSKHAIGSFAFGRTHFELLLRYRHHLDIDADSLYKFGKNLFDQTWRELRDITMELRGDDDVHALSKSLQADHLVLDDLIDRYRQTIDAAKTFVEQHQLVSLPRKEKLTVIETPEFLRHQIPFAAYHEPAPNDPEQHGYYYVTPPETEDGYGEHNSISLAHTSVHEAWPGHHLQFVTANLSAASSTVPRLLNPSAMTYEGWALYCEALMQEKGFLSSPASRFILLKDRLWRAMRVMLDVELHCRSLALDDAIQRMVEQLDFTPAQARADLDWYTRAPTVPMGYATGWALITATRTRLEHSESAFELKGFHDRLLACGSIALPEVIRKQFGQPMWESVRRSVFG